MIGRRTACGVCYCGPVWGGGQPQTDSDMFWVVLECVRCGNAPIARPELNDRLTHYGVYADEGQRDEVAVDRALQLLLDRHRIEGGDLDAVTDGTRETAYTFAHLPQVTRRRIFRRHKTSGDSE